MTCQELIEYLQKFDSDEMVSVLIVNSQKRKVYQTEEMIIIDEAPCLTFKVGDEKDYNEFISNEISEEK